MSELPEEINKIIKIVDQAIISNSPAVTDALEKLRLLTALEGNNDDRSGFLNYIINIMLEQNRKLIYMEERIARSELTINKLWSELEKEKRRTNK